MTIYYENYYMSYTNNYYYYNYNFMAYSNSISSTSITSDGYGSIYFGGYDMRRVTPINANTSSGTNPYGNSSTSLYGFTGLSFDSSGSCYGLIGSTMVKLTLISNSC